MPPDIQPEEIALFLDFDGCLVDLAPRHDAVIVPPGLAARLRAVHAALDGAVALISGRDVAALRAYLPDFPGAIAGSHGAELSLDGGAPRTRHEDFDVAALHARAAALAQGRPGIVVEPKPHGVVLHYRANPDLRPWVEAAMRDLAADYPALAVQAAKMAVELHPAGAGKDRALAHLMTQPPFAGRRPVYAGDDLTDEAAMAEAQARGGYGIKIGTGDTVARHRLPDPAALSAWLDRAVTARAAGQGV